MAVYRRYPKAWPPEFSQFVRRRVALNAELRAFSDEEFQQRKDEYDGLLLENRKRLAAFLETWTPVNRVTLQRILKRKFSDRYYRNASRGEVTYLYEDASYSLIWLMYGFGNSTLPTKDVCERVRRNDSRHGLKRVDV